MVDPGWANRFYGMDVSPAVAAAVRERLTETESEDLVDAHLGINYAYFGAIDKTLSGFVVLDDEGDNYTLLDLRDGQQIWWQDHETRELVLKHDRLEDYVTVRAALEADDADRETIEAAYRAETAKTSRLVSSDVLLGRYQWLVWLLAQPLMQHGAPMQSADELVRNGIGRFRYTWPRREQHDEAFDAEVGELARDPHLAVYWLLHTTVLGDEARRARVTDAIGSSGPPLVRAFSSRFGGLPLAGELPIVPEFRCRRALATLYGGFELSPEEISRAALRALEIEPGTNTLRNALQVIDGLDKGHLEESVVADAMARITSSTSGIELVLAVLDKRAGVTSSAHADTLARRVDIGTQMWWFALEALWLVHELAFDGEGLLAATRAIIANDRYHPRALQMAIRAAKLCNEPTTELEADLEIANAILPALQQIFEQPDSLKDALLPLPELARRALAHRVLQRASINRPDASIAAWAAGLVVADPAGAPLVGAALTSLDTQTQADVIARAKDSIDGAMHPFVEVLLAFLDGPEPPENDLSAKFGMKRGKEAAIAALAPWAHEAALFDRVMQLLERPAGSTTVELICSRLLNPLQKDTYLVPRLDATQAVRLAKAMIAVELRHPQIHSRNAAGHQLFRFHHAGAESFLIDALDEYSTKYADVMGPGGAQLDRGKTEHDELEDVVANLYNAVRGLKTTRARTALLGRLATERRSFWRMGSAIKDTFDDELHAEAMTMLRMKRDARAAGCYAYALVDHVKTSAPLLELAREIVDWTPGDDATERSFFHYALAVGEKAALDAKDYDLVRRTHAAQAWIEEPALDPDDHAKGKSWKNPLDEPSVVAVLQRVLSGEADTSKQKLAAEGEAARKAGKRNTRISDAQLGELAGAVVQHRLLHDPSTGEIWFRDADRKVYCFDGFGVATPPFEAQAIALGGMRDHLRGVEAIDERVLEWDARHAHYRELVRFGSRVVINWGVNNGSTERQLLLFPSVDAAAAAFAQLRAHPPKGYVASDPYYVDGAGAVVRNYYVPLPDGGYNDKRQALSLEVDVLDRDAAIASHLAKELAWLRDGNATVLSLEWSSNLRRPQDLTVKEWIAKRFRSDGKSPVWHLRALADLSIYFEAHALVCEGLDLQLGAPAKDEDIDAFEAHRTEPVPESLRTLWRTHGRASWKLGDRGLRLLGPREALARRPAARALGEAYLAKLPPAEAVQASAAFDHLDVLVETLDGTPVTVIADLVRDDGRVFTHAGTDPSDIWWEVSLSWMLATRLLGELSDALDERMPILARLYYGQRRNPDEQLVYLEKAGTFWEITFDPAAAVVATRFGKIGAAGSTTVERVSLATAPVLVEKKVAEKKKDGYREVTAKVAAKSKVVAKKPAAKKPAAKQRAAKKPAAKKPAAAAKKKSAKKPAAAVKKKSAKKPTAKKPTAKKPTAKKSR